MVEEYESEFTSPINRGQGLPIKRQGMYTTVGGITKKGRGSGYLDYSSIETFKKRGPFGNDIEAASPNKKVGKVVNALQVPNQKVDKALRNDYSQHFVDTGKLPQNFIRDTTPDERFRGMYIIYIVYIYIIYIYIYNIYIDYPKLKELIKRKTEVIKKRGTPAMCLKADLRSLDLSTLGKFDIILVDPPWEGYWRRVAGLPVSSATGGSLRPWSFEDIQNVRVDLLADSPSFLFVWAGSAEGLDEGRVLLKKWGFRRCEDVIWVKSNMTNSESKMGYSQTLANEDHLLYHSKEHCLVGIKGTVRRGQDSHFIHANIDTDIVVSEDPEFGSTEKPKELYDIIERFCLGRRRIELFGGDNSVRQGWLTVGPNLSTHNYDGELYDSWFKGTESYPLAQGYQGGRYLGTTPEIDNLRPRSPPRYVTIPPLMALPILNFMQHTPPFPADPDSNVVNALKLEDQEGGADI